jgi:hypothetical protein
MLLLGKGLSHPWAPSELMESGYANQKIKIQFLNVGFREKISKVHIPQI